MEAIAKELFHNKDREPESPGEMLQNFLYHVLSDSYYLSELLKVKIELQDEDDAKGSFYGVYICDERAGKCRYLNFRVNDMVAVELGEDNYEYVEYFNGTERFFWWAFLEWPFD